MFYLKINHTEDAKGVDDPMATLLPLSALIRAEIFKIGFWIKTLTVCVTLV